MSTLADQVDVVVGVDTHRITRRAALVAPTGAEFGALKVPATRTGHAQLLRWVEQWPRARRAWAIEGTSTHGAGLCRVLRAAGERIIEIDHQLAQRVRTDRRPTRLTPCAPDVKHSPVRCLANHAKATIAKRYGC